MMRWSRRTAKGIALGARAQELLDGAQQRIEELQASADEQAG